MVRDLRLALRNLLRQPGFTLVAAVTLALGIGASTAVFSVVNAVLLKPLAYPGSDRIVTVTTNTRGALSGPDYLDLKKETTAFEAMGYYYNGQINVQTRNGAEFSGAAFTSQDFFRVFGTQPLVGRLYTAADTAPTAVVSPEFAARNYGSASNAVGQTVSIYEVAYTIVGVSPSSLQFPARTSVWVRAPETPENGNRTAHNYRGIARLRTDATLNSAEVQLRTIGSRLEQQFPRTHTRKTFRATPLQEVMAANSRETLNALLGAVLVLLLIACANVANLLLARGSSRSREIAVRAALGAGAGRILSMLLAESFLLALAAAAGGVVLAYLGISALVSLAPETTPRLNEAAIDGRVLLFTGLLALASMFVFGLIPCWQALRVDLQETLKRGGTRGVVSGGGRARRALVVSEIALAFVLAVAAGLIFRSFLKLNEVELGFRQGGVLVAYAAVPAKDLDSHVRAGRFFAGLREKLRSIPGVESASAAMGVPSGAYNSNGAYAVEGKHDFKSGNIRDLPQTRLRLAGAEYFQVMGIPLLRGREFSDRDSYEAPFVAIISESLAKQSFGGEDPLGKRLQCGLDSPNWMTIVGVVGDVRSDSPATAPSAELYMPYQQHPFYSNELQVVVRTSMDPGVVTAPVRKLISTERPDVAMRFETLESMVAGSIAMPRFRTVLMASFSMVALLLALVGVYGVMAYMVEQRRNEFGVRLALGATGADLARLTLAGALRLAAIGLAGGIVLALAARKVLQAFLFEIDSADLVTWGVAFGSLGLVALLAAWWPARRASQVDPAEVLRGD